MKGGTLIIILNMKTQLFKKLKAWRSTFKKEWEKSQLSLTKIEEERLSST